jgi:putative addiction module component (TIGR02574 family)
MQNALLAEINSLSVVERMFLVEEIWDHFTDAEDATFELSEAQRIELDQRISYYQNHPEGGRYWNDVREEYSAK